MRKGTYTAGGSDLVPVFSMPRGNAFGRTFLAAVLLLSWSFVTGTPTPQFHVPFGARSFPGSTAGKSSWILHLSQVPAEILEGGTWPAPQSPVNSFKARQGGIFMGYEEVDYLILLRDLNLPDAPETDFLNLCQEHVPAISHDSGTMYRAPPVCRAGKGD
jgi:hypothetical protein